MPERVRVLLVGLALASCGETAAPRGERPNLVLISVDTLRPDFLGCYGHAGDVSPRIDALAARGVVFEDVTSSAPWTLPAHATMLTGMYPSTHGVRTHEFALTEESLATWLGKAGYQTIAVVNSHNIGFPQYGLLRGFDAAEWVPEMEVGSGGRMTPGPIRNMAARIVKRALQDLERRDRSRPFFLFLHFYDVHTDFTPFPKWEAKYVAPYEGPLTPITQDLNHARIAMQLGNLTLTPADVDYLRQMYDAEIRTFDDRLGVLLDELEAQGLLESTIVALTSDHGEEYGEHGGLLHGRTHFQELVRIPLVLAGPGVPVGRRIGVPLHLVDLAPMLYALAGVPPPPRMDGLDASLAWREPERLPARRFLFSEADHNNVTDQGEEVHDVKRMVRLGNLVLQYDTRDGRKELYDLSADPGEQRDLAQAEPELVAELFTALEVFLGREGSARVIGPVSEENQALLDQLGYGGGGD